MFLGLARKNGLELLVSVAIFHPAAGFGATGKNTVSPIGWQKRNFALRNTADPCEAEHLRSDL
ncbi:MAG: hypothetical protein L7W94_02145 [Alphaproteobacteria bacterium]|jgi:hypothetical protein|nr:hypothetical protein [Alphaproteobacteria bacterium]